MAEFQITSSAGTQLKECRGDLWYKWDKPQQYQGLAEVLTSRFLQNLVLPKGLSFVSYRPICEAGKTGCVSSSFSSNPWRSASLFHYLQRHMGTDNPVGCFAASDVYQSYDKMMNTFVDLFGSFAPQYFTWLQLIDTVVLNGDRHWNNINVLTNIRNNRVSLAPLFDFGEGLGANVIYPDVSWESIIKFSQTACKWITPSFDDALKVAQNFSPITVKWRSNRVLLSDLEQYYPKEIIARAFNILQARSCAYLGLSLVPF